MIPARLTPRGGVAPGIVYRAYCDGRLLAELVCADEGTSGTRAGSCSGDLERVVDDLWHAVEPTVNAGHKVLLACYDSRSGLPLPVGDTVVAAS